MSGINIVNVIGGVGNQLFQYMFGRYLEEQTGRKTRYDISDYGKYKLHDGFSLENIFNIELPRCPDRDVWAASPFLKGYGSKRFFYKISPFLGRLSPMITDETLDIDKIPKDASRPLYYKGYWHHIPYGPTLAAVRDRLVFKGDVIELAKKGLDYLRVDIENSAAIHIRRGDYLTQRPNSAVYPLPIEYYISAMNVMSAEGIRKFVVFSDGIEQVKKEMGHREGVTFVDRHASSSAGSDLCMLTRFPHQIISNSTFGWWSAALRKEPAGVVIIPDPWINPAFSGDHGRAPIFLQGWRRLNVFAPGL